VTDTSLPAAQKLARTMIDSRAPGRSGANSAARAAAGACDHTYRELSRWVGHDGCHALFTRARAQARGNHPLLEQIQLRPRGDPYLEQMTETIDAHGNAPTREALEAVLGNLFHLLGRLVGDDMAKNLIQRSLTSFNSADASVPTKRGRPQ